MVTAKDTEYTGNTVAVVVKDGDKTLVEGKDYTVIYSGSNQMQERHQQQLPELVTIKER